MVGRETPYEGDRREDGKETVVPQDPEHII